MYLPKLPKAIERVFAIVAHPDDAEIWAGGLLALAPCADILVLTAGGAGVQNADPTLWANLDDRDASYWIRADEQKASAAVLGVAHTLEPKHPPVGEEAIQRMWRNCLAPIAELQEDGYVHVNASTRNYLIRCIRRVRPTLVVTHPLWDRHPDHRAVSEMVTAAVELVDKPGLHVWGDVPNADRLVCHEPCQLPGLWYFHNSTAHFGALPHFGKPMAVARHGIFTEFFLDIGSVMDIKQAAINCHVSQRAEYPEDYPRLQASQWADEAHVDCEYAEIFYASPYGRDLPNFMLKDFAEASGL